MTSKKKAKKAPVEPTFASRPAAEGTAVSFIVKDQEVTLKAAETEDGWAITPSSEAEQRALDTFSDEMLNPPAAPESPAEPETSPSSPPEGSVQTPGDGGDAPPDNEPTSTDENAGAPGQEDQA